MDRRTSPTEVSRMCAKMTQPSLALVRPVNCARTIYMKNATLPKTTPWWSNGTAISAERRGGIRAKTRSHDEICPDVDRTTMSAEKPAAFPFFSHRRCRPAGTSPGVTFHRDADTRPVSTHAARTSEGRGDTCPGNDRRSQLTITSPPRSRAEGRPQQGDMLPIVVHLANAPEATREWPSEIALRASSPLSHEEEAVAHRRSRGVCLREPGEGLLCQRGEPPHGAESIAAYTQTQRKAVTWQ